MRKKRIVRNIFCISLVFIAFLFSCNSHTPHFERVCRLAEENKKELLFVLEHYKGDKQKLAAAKFLLNNMLHSSTQNNLSEAYRSAVMDSGASIDYNAIWKNITDRIGMEKSSKIYDAQVISADYLIKNIDEAFSAWEQSAWYNEIDFETFCNYILPYRVLDEPISEWRSVLYKKYKPFIEGIECPLKAYATIYHHVLNEFKDRSYKYPYTPDVLMLDKMQEGVCSHRCVYLISVLRSLGIPASYDLVYYWANYSQGGHSWVAYVGNNGKTKTMLKNDSIPKERNRIDSSIFELNPDIEFDPEHFQYKIDSLKKTSKVFRKTYKIRLDIGELYPNKNLSFFNDLFIEDVSNEYGLDGQVEFDGYGKQQLFLCTFAAIKNWQPVAKGEKERVTSFKNIGTEVAYLPVYYSDGQMIPIENPFILHSNGVKRTLLPDTTFKERVVLKRKYLLFAHWINRWSKIIGAGIDGSNHPTFAKYDRLYQFTEIPDGITRMDIEATKPYRYIRFETSIDTRPNIAEMKFYGVNHKKDTVLLTGDMICEKIDPGKAALAFDDNYSTYTQTPINNYWFGLDLGKNNSHTLSKIEFCMRHDMNMIEVGDHYELFYYDYGWKSLGKQTATCDSLVYDNTPSKALLWLKNHTKGREERIFTYENGKQIWW